MLINIVVTGITVFTYMYFYVSVWSKSKIFSLFDFTRSTVTTEFTE